MVSYIICISASNRCPSAPTTTSLRCVVSLLFLLTLLLLTFLLSTHQTPQISTCTLPRIRNPLPSITHTTSHRARTTLHTIHSTLAISTQRSLTLDRVAMFVLSAALSAVDALFRECVADGLRKAALTNLAGDEVVDAVLEVVDLGDACHLGFVEVF